MHKIIGNTNFHFFICDYETSPDYVYTTYEYYSRKKLDNAVFLHAICPEENKGNPEPHRDKLKTLLIDGDFLFKKTKLNILANSYAENFIIDIEGLNYFYESRHHPIKGIHKLDYLPVTLKNIILVDRLDLKCNYNCIGIPCTFFNRLICRKSYHRKRQDVIEWIKRTFEFNLIKIPFNCKVYYVDSHNKSFLVYQNG